MNSHIKYLLYVDTPKLIFISFNFYISPSPIIKYFIDISSSNTNVDPKLLKSSSITSRDFSLGNICCPSMDIYLFPTIFPLNTIFRIFKEKFCPKIFLRLLSSYNYILCSYNITVIL